MFPPGGGSDDGRWPPRRVTSMLSDPVYRLLGHSFLARLMVDFSDEIAHNRPNFLMHFVLSESC